MQEKQLVLVVGDLPVPVAHRNELMLNCFKIVMTVNELHTCQDYIVLIYFTHIYECRRCIIGNTLEHKYSAKFKMINSQEREKNPVTNHTSLCFKMERLVTYGKNQKGNITLIDDNNYEYNFEKTHKGKKYWRCRFFQRGCKERAISRKVIQ